MSRKTASTEPWKPFCPEGYRFIFQATDSKTEADACDQVRLYFDRTDSVAVPGCFRLTKMLTGREDWKWCPDSGFMCFVPVLS